MYNSYFHSRCLAHNYSQFMKHHHVHKYWFILWEQSWQFLRLVYSKIIFSENLINFAKFFTHHILYFVGFPLSLWSNIGLLSLKGKIISKSHSQPISNSCCNTDSHDNMWTFSRSNPTHNDAKKVDDSVNSSIDKRF